MTKMTQEIARAAAQDAGNRSMRKAGRKVWNLEDYLLANCKYNELWPEEKETGTEPLSPSKEVL